MIGPCYRSVAHDGALLASYEEYIWRAGAKAAGAYSSAHIMLTGHFAPPPALLAATCVCWGLMDARDRSFLAHVHCFERTVRLVGRSQYNRYGYHHLTRDVGEAAWERHENPI